jgi:predicted transcriptional regulator
VGRPKPTRPTDAELAILNVLWERKDGLTIRQIAAELKKHKPSTYATVQTLVRIMDRKGLVKRGLERYPTVYFPVAPEENAKTQLVREFMDRVFGGSMKQLLVHALSSQKTSAKELDQIEKIIDQMED